jgi:predicted O-methyltransferase YrrM
MSVEGPLVPLLEEIYRSGSVETSTGERMDALPTGVGRGDALAIARLVRERGCERTIEIGLAHGLSTLAMAGEHERRGQGRHLAIDPWQASRFGRAGTTNVARAGLERWVEVVEGPAEFVLPRLAEAQETFDLAFVDGLHLYDQTLVEFFYLDRMLPPGGLVVLHDPWLRAIRAVAGFVESNRAYERDPFEATDNLIVLRKTADDARAWDHWVEPRRERGWPRR